MEYEFTEEELNDEKEQEIDVEIWNGRKFPTDRHLALEKAKWKRFMEKRNIKNGDK
jgi:hypothetical protein